MAEFIEVLSGDAKKELDAFVAKIKDGVQAVNEMNKASKGMKIVPSEATKQIKQTTTATQKQNEMQKEATRISRALERQKAKLAQAESKAATELQKYRFETREANKRAKEAAILSSNLASEYQKQQVKLTQLIRKQQDLAVKQQLGVKLSKQEAAQYKRLTSEIRRKDAALKRVDASAGKFQRNVGNYTSALKGAAGAARGMVAALGLMGGAFLAVQVIRDAFNRVRQFDKAMQNLAGILGVNRKELKGLEQSIISVAGSSIKTSNEVADLATKLITLGKTESEVKMLLPVVNDLGIALETTGEQAGELLISTLNAFGESIDEAQRFADVIARTRQITALDFERIKDALGFLAPTARAVGLSFERTNAILGVLVDNGIKAARAGRLMNTAFNRLTSQGLSLDEALVQINNSNNKLKTSSSLLGSEAGTLGLILADNTKNVNKYDEALQDVNGTMQSLIDEQMEAMDAKLLQLDSSWERLILSIENGEGKFGKTFQFIIETLTKVIDKLTEFSEGNEAAWMQGATDGMKRYQKEFKGIEAGTEAAEEKINDLESSIHSLRLGLGRITKQQSEKGFTDLFTNMFGFGDSKRLEDEAKQKLKLISELQEAIKIARQGGVESSDKENADPLVGDKETQAITIKFYEDLISKLKQLQKEVPEDDPLKFQELQTDIDNAEESLLKLMRLFKGFEDQESVNFLGESDLTPVIEQIDLVGKAFEEQGDKVTEFSEKMKADLQGAFSEIGRIYQLDMTRWDALFDDKENTARDFAIAFADLLGAAMHQVTQMEVARIDQQIEQNRRYYENQIELAEGNENQQELLRQQSAAKERKLMQRRAEAEKKQAIFETIISTAVAVAKALPNIPFSILVGALGAAKVAMINAQPLPQYKKGRKDGKEEYAILGDGGKNEPVIGKDGKLKAISPNKSTVMHLDKGDKVLPNLDMLTDDSVNRAAIMASLSQSNQQSQTEDTAKVFEQILKKQQKETMKALKGAKFVNVNQNNIDLGRMLKKQKYR